MKQTIYDKIKRYCDENEIFQQGDRVLIGLSGGADSVFLVCALLRLAPVWDLTLGLVHVNHGIRGDEAKRDEDFCVALAERLELPIRVFRGDVPKMVQETGMTEEEAARNYRYQCMEDMMRVGYQKVAVAHHMDDQAETVLFQLLRGSQLRGLGGMRPVRECIVRPLLCVRRKEIEEELNVLGESWCEDSTNGQCTYSRNRLRQEVLPVLEGQVMQGSVEHLAKEAGQLQEIYDYLRQQAKKAYDELVRRENCGEDGAGDLDEASPLQESRKTGRYQLSVRAFAELHPAVQKELIMQLLEQAAGSRKDLTRQHVESVCRLSESQTGKTVNLPYGLLAGREYDLLWVKQEDTKGRQQNRKNQDVTMIAREELEQGTWQLPVESDSGRERMVLKIENFQEKNFEKVKKQWKNDCTKRFDYDRINGMLAVRHPMPGDYLVLDEQGRHKKLSRILIDAHISRTRREQIWILAEGQHVLWIPQLGRCSAYYYVTKDTQRILAGDFLTESKYIEK